MVASPLFKLFSLNARGLNDYNKRNTLYDWLQDLDIDIVLLQETHFIETRECSYNARWRGTCYHCFSDSSSSRGVSILIRQNLAFEFISCHKSTDGRKLLFNIKINDTVFTIANLYAPNKVLDRKSFFTNLKSWIRRKASTTENLIVFGDFNCKLDENQDFDTSKHQLFLLIRQLGLSDIWTKMNENKSGFTWCNAQNVPYSRIDYAFISKNFSYSIDSLTLRNCPQVNNNRLSDHLGLRLDLIIEQNKRGPGYWKMNTSILLDKDYCTSIKQMLMEKELEINAIECPHERWENVKYLIKQVSVEFSVKRSKSLKQRAKSIEEKIKIIETSPPEEMNYTEKISLEKELNEIYENKSKGTYI